MIINDVQFNNSLEEVFEELQKQLELNGIQYFQKGYKHSGNSIQVQCPFHGNGQERKPSAGIRKSDGMFHCFACNEIHTLPEVVSFCFGYSDIFGREGWKWLLKNFATIQVEERKDVVLDYQRPFNKYSGDRIMVGTVDEIREYVSEEELEKYRYYHKYWKKRGIVDEDIIELFDLGYDKKTDCITFPIRDIEGNCLFVARRNVKTKFFNYPQGVEKPLYGLYELYNSEYQWGYMNTLPHDCHEIIVCESMIDCLLLWQEKHYAVALNGLGNDLQFKQLNDLPCRKLILATDNDEAGMKARMRIRKHIKKKLITEISFPRGVKDIGECKLEEIKNIKDWEVF